VDEDIITGIFCDVDDFCAALEKYVKARLHMPGGAYPTSESCQLHGQPAGGPGRVQFSAAQAFHSDEGRKGACFDPRL